MSDEERNDGQGSEAPEAPAPPRYEVRPVGSGSHGDEFIDGVPTGSRVPLRDYGGTGVILGQPLPDAEEAAVLRAENERLKEQYEKIEHLGVLAEKPVFREILQQYIDMGEVEGPRIEPTEPADIIEYKKRMAEPEAAAILEAMNSFAETLPDYEKEVIDRSHKAWIKTYDKMKALGAGNFPKRPLPAAYQNAGPMDRRTLETIIRSKEVDRARVERPGNTTPEYPQTEPDGEKRWRQALANQNRAYNNGRPIDREAADNALVEAFFDRKTPRRSTGGGY